MVLKTIAEFKVPYLQILDETGKCDEKLLPKEINESMVKKFYEAMILARTFDSVALKLQREGRMLTYGSMLGQEAQVGVPFALTDGDWTFPSFRENGVAIVRGVPPELLYLYWMGDERGNAIPKPIKHFTVCVPVSTQVLHAVGVAWAEKMNKSKNVVTVFFGDGATSEGDFHEGMNFAGAFKLPVIFFCQNNQWAISVPRSRQTAAQTLAQKAIAYGFEGIQIDGNDIFAVYSAVKDAVQKARDGKGPTLIEMFTYRMSDHTTADDAKRYRDPKEVEAWRKKDPIDRLVAYMKAKKIWTPQYEKKVQADAEKKISEAVKKAESTPSQKPSDVFDYVFSELPPILKEQRQEVTGK